MKQFFLHMFFLLFGCSMYVYGAEPLSWYGKGEGGVLGQSSLQAMVRLHDIFRAVENHFWYFQDPLYLEQKKDELIRLIQGDYLFAELKPYAQDLLNLMNVLPVDEQNIDQAASQFQVLLADYSEKESELVKNINAEMIEKEKTNKNLKGGVFDKVEAKKITRVVQPAVIPTAVPVAAPKKLTAGEIMRMKQASQVGKPVQRPAAISTPAISTPAISTPAISTPAIPTAAPVAAPKKLTAGEIMRMKQARR